ncbi:helix-turn-helix transcriptional regulator [Klebsiella grimontii]|uniref:helix-turn-helix transcriptional regulator n=1 Tax=Klebsiella grimontii TaxID=2058152 RepID=UPI001D518AE2|nr:AlpA family transcriptional regulator [Klebsiella grimontii]EGT0064136.1 AlpA family transcriptional regulator [Klebsiella michiganensis]WDI68922.1 AlpA family transcriptional regulator [Klebsiella grimontii]HBQ6156093.1 AlpA family transcriptional regulator [Klebsiella pneumoniae]
MNGSKRLIRISEVISKTGFSKAWIYRLISQKRFPSAIKTGSRAIAFLESEVDDWINERVSQSRDKIS